MYNGNEFWNNLERTSPFKTWMEFAEKCGMSYNTVKQQRSDKTIPRTSDLLKIAETLNTSIEFLLTGKERDTGMYNDRVNKIAWHCQHIASEEDLFIIEKILGINSSYKVVRKDVIDDANGKNSGIA